ncbi:polysaccharide deacetylase family protein [Gordoniibacillus kamchatkensis]|uniref:polysaccharide deacetylase family protein n=1 Tax=Gordoniibacillus kamchatkensis TaxID=1590651 RepID=UPI000697598F|nr:polysaccharide deacetylase family protein [Paenibacillus sp. VKM B-2647]
MWAKRLLAMMFAGAIALSAPGLASAERAPIVPTCLIVYQNEDLRDDANIAANLAGHFNMNREIEPLSQLTPEAVAKADSIIAILQKPDETFERKLQAEGKPGHSVLWVGAADGDSKTPAAEIRYKGNVIQELNTTVYPLRVREGMDKLAEVSDGTNVYTLAAHAGNEWRYASPQLTGAPGLVFADMLHDVFHAEHADDYHEAYIRIEDVHPLTDPKKLRAIADFLYSRHIPFMVAVIPVYTDAAGGNVVNFEDKPEFTAALHYMEDRGGSLIMHGYKHRYRDGETGEGFEFWDAQSDKPIPDEAAYMTDKLEKGIARMAKQGLYPLAFEPPHYAMSQTGYRIVNRYFSTLVGNLQLNDTTYLVSQQPPYRLQHSLAGLKVVPETIGYVADEAGAAAPMLEKAKQLMIVRDSVIGAFFHPYLKLSQLTELVDGLSALNVDFIDLKAESNEVRTDFITIRSDGGQVTASIQNRSKLDALAAVPAKSKLAPLFSLVMTWGIAAVVTLFLIMFFWFLLLLRTRRKKRLFYEEVRS